MWPKAPAGVPQTIELRIYTTWEVVLTYSDNSTREFMGTPGNWMERYGESLETLYDPELESFLDKCI
jgi:hypothetical protein